MYSCFDTKFVIFLFQFILLEIRHKFRQKFVLFSYFYDIFIGKILLEQQQQPNVHVCSFYDGKSSL